VDAYRRKIGCATCKSSPQAAFDAREHTPPRNSGECALFYEVDEQLRTIPKHPEAHLWPSEVITLGLLHALKGMGNRPFYRWLTCDYRPLLPWLPERTRLFRLLKTHQDWTRAFLATPTVLGVNEASPQQAAGYHKEGHCL
jgi:hypothetical protein